MTSDRYLELGQPLRRLPRARARDHGEGRRSRPAPAPRVRPCRAARSSKSPVPRWGSARRTERKVFDDHNLARLLHGGAAHRRESPNRFRAPAWLDKNITRLVKSDAGGGRFEGTDDPADVLKLAGRAGRLDLVEEFGVDPDRDRALDPATRLAIGAGFDALRDAGIPLVQRYKTTTLGTQLPDRWGLPEATARRHRCGLRVGVPRFRPHRRLRRGTTPPTRAPRELLGRWRA